MWDQKGFEDEITGFDRAWALNERGVAKFIYSQKIEEPIADYTAAIAADQSYAWPYFNRGLRLLQQGKLVEALTDVQTALRRFKPAKNCLPPGCDLRRDARATADVLVDRHRH